MVLPGWTHVSEQWRVIVAADVSDCSTSQFGNHVRGPAEMAPTAGELRAKQPGITRQDQTDEVAAAPSRAHNGEGALCSLRSTSQNPGVSMSSRQYVGRTEVERVEAVKQALRMGDVGYAQAELIAMAASWPGQPEVLRLQAVVFDMRGMRRDAVATMQRAIALRPDDATYYNTLGGILSNSGELDTAIATLQQACKLQPSLAVAWYNLGVMLAQCVYFEDAIAAFSQALKLEPDNVATRVRLADVLRNRGQLADAANEYRDVLRTIPWSGAAWWGLAALRTVPFTQADILSMQSALDAPDASRDDKTATGFAFAMALDDSGRHAESLAALQRAKTISREYQQWNAAAFAQTASCLRATFTPAPAGATTRDLGHEVIFIVGLPRSGTTLVEQVLASHPHVEGSGELPDLRLVLEEESRRRQVPFPGWVGAADAGDWERLGRRYLERTRRWRKHRQVFTDKLPNNWMYVGAVMAMLPGAHVVCCRRDPLETCFSCYRHYRNRHDYTDTFADLVEYWQQYDQSVRLWRAHYPTRVYEHSYENLLTNPDVWVRRLLEFCELSWEPGCLQFHENQREVRSPSASQVRRPLQSDTARTTRYGALLDPLRVQLGLPRFVNP